MKLFDNWKTVINEIISSRISFVIRVFELFLSILLLASVFLAGIYVVISFIIDFSQVEGLVEYQNFQQLLSYILLLIIALELAVMLINRNPGKVVEVMIYAIARKMLINNASAVEILLGVIALAILLLMKIFVIKKYCNQDKQSQSKEPDHEEGLKEKQE